MNRKKFLITSTLTAIGLSSFGKVRKLSDGTFDSDCETTNDILGPFYRSDAPIRSDLTYEGLKGTRIELKGKVYQSDCVTPLKSAMVEIWHCDTNGVYDNESKAYHQRARWITSEDGQYSFKTILPGKYLNGQLFRPAHIHYRVTAANCKELISQIYFKGDPHIEKDPWASKEKAKLRIIELIPQDTNGNLSLNFDIYLRKK